jgi:hypothetical protein
MCTPTIRLRPAAGRIRRFLPLLTVLLVGSIGAGRAAAQEAATGKDTTAVLRGQVVSAMTGGPLHNAQVSLLEAGVGTYTDSTGHFVLSGVSAGPDTLHVRLIGFADQSVPISLQGNRVTTATLMLSQTVLQLADIHVTVRHLLPIDKLSGFENRKRTRQGVFLTPEQIDKKREYANKSADLLRGLPGISVGESTVGHTSIRVPRGQRWCTPFIWVNNQPMPNLAIDDLSPESILAMEIYRSGSETPPQFVYRGFTGQCATIVVWTRDGRHH